MNTHQHLSPDEKLELEQAAISEYCCGNIATGEFVRRLANCGLNATEIETAIKLYFAPPLIPRR